MLVDTGFKHLGFQPTYKGLKPELGFISMMRDGGFQPTYKGLKQGEGYIWIRNNRFVFSLPIRDWNLFHLDVETYLLWVFSLPIRDWNGRQDQEWWELWCVFSLPIRDWNQYDKGEREEMYESFQPTYKGLKHNSYPDQITILIRFSAYL